MRQRPGICGLLTHVHAGVYVEKHPCHYYGGQSRLQLVTRARYTGLHAVSSQQSPGVQSVSLLKTSSFTGVSF